MKLTPTNSRRIATVLAQKALNIWNGGGFDDIAYFEKAGKRITDAVESLLNRCLAQEAAGAWTCLCMNVNQGTPACTRCGADTYDDLKEDRR